MHESVRVGGELVASWFLVSSESMGDLLGSCTITSGSVLGRLTQPTANTPAGGTYTQYTTPGHQHLVASNTPVHLWTRGDPAAPLSRLDETKMARLCHHASRKVSPTVETHTTEFTE